MGHGPKRQKFFGLEVLEAQADKKQRDFPLLHALQGPQRVGHQHGRERMRVAARQLLLVNIIAYPAFDAADPRVVLRDLDEVGDHRCAQNRLRIRGCIKPWLLQHAFARQVGGQQTGGGEYLALSRA